MKKVIFLLLAFTGLITIAGAQTKNPAKFEVSVAFGSMCCGTASDDFLKASYKKFIKVNKVKIPAFKAEGCGKEGEYNVLFSLTKLKPAMRKKFIAEIKNVTIRQDKKNKIKDSSSGSINVEYNVAATDISHCRGGINNWL